MIHVLLALSGSLTVQFLLGESSPHGASPLLTKVQWLVLSACIQLTQVSTLVVIDDRQYTSNGLSNHLARMCMCASIIHVVIT